ncbi:MAG: FecR domain-containing protein [Chitinophagaceae bacterium]
MDIHQAKELLQRYQAGSCTLSENELVESWYEQLIETDEWEWGEGEKDMMQHIIEARILEQTNDSQKIKGSRFFLLSRSSWWAAAAVFLIGTFSYFFLFNTTSKPAQIVKVLRNDVKAPQSNKAMITLANGQKIYLDSVGNDSLATQGNVKLVKLKGGEIAYQQSAGDGGKNLQYNTLTNPRGSKVINMFLADGSKIWLNAGSAVTYPVAFVGVERKVSVTGEAYFEVAHDASKPFIVNYSSMSVEVLGTHFNINAFEDEDHDVKVTLLKGSVKIDNENANRLLKPGQQALVNKEIKVKSDVDLSFVMAWKDGYFQFNNASLQNVLKQVSRWYDVDVVYEGSNQPRQFVGEMQKNLNLSEMLKILEKNEVHFRIEEKRLIVKPD